MKKNFGLKLEQNLAVRLFFSVDVRIKNVLAIVKMFADLLCVGFTEQDYLTYLNLNSSDADPEKVTKAKDYFERIKLLME
jgi:hypothetical protein